MNATAPIETPATGDTDFDTADWNPIPFHLREGLHEYIRMGRSTGDFLKAVLSNDFIKACLRADHMSERGLKATAQFLMWHAPAASYGSEKNYENWIRSGGLVGIAAARKVPA